MKPCLRHYNILMKNSGVEDARFVEIGCSEAHRNEVLHDRRLRQACRGARRSEGPPDTHCPHGVCSMTSSVHPCTLHGRLWCQSLFLQCQNGRHLLLHKCSGAMHPSWKPWCQPLTKVPKASPNHGAKDFFLRVYCFSRGRPLSHNQGLQTLCCVVEFVGMRFMPQEEHAAGRMTMTRLKELRKAAGFACTREGLLCDRELRPWVDFAAIVTKDWVHTFLQDGIMQNEVLLFVHSAQHLGVTLQRLRSFLREPWRFPSRCGCTGKNMHKVFDDKRSNMGANKDDMQRDARSVRHVEMLR